MELRQEFWRHATPKAQKRIADKFGIYWDDQMQDWDLVSSNPGWIPQLLNAYQNDSFDDDEKFALMELVIASFDDLAKGGSLLANRNWHMCETILRSEFWLHIASIHNWSLLERADVNDSFPMTKYIRPIWEEVKVHFI